MHACTHKQYNISLRYNGTTILILKHLYKFGVLHFLIKMSQKQTP